MLIDWFTVIAQLLNFLVLVWLMKRFLYQPILEALDARERRISAELNDASSKKQEAQAEQDEFVRKNQEFDQQRAELFKVASDEAKTERQRLLSEARQEANELRIQQRQAMKAEQQNLIASLSRHTQAEVFAIARQTLADLAGLNLEQQIVAVFVDKLQQLPETEKQTLVSALKNPGVLLTVRTAFDLTTAQIAEIEQAIRETFGIETQVQFKTAPDMISGIELCSDGHKVSWSIADYLGSLEKNLNDILQASV